MFGRQRGSVTEIEALREDLGLVKKFCRFNFVSISWKCNSGAHSRETLQGEGKKKTKKANRKQNDAAVRFTLCCRLVELLFFMIISPTVFSPHPSCFLFTREKAGHKDQGEAGSRTSSGSPSADGIPRSPFLLRRGNWRTLK